MANNPITGTSGNDAGPDTLLGTDLNDVIYGKAGNDKLRGGKGDDLLLGGSGNDRLNGDDGNDRLNGVGQSKGTGERDRLVGGSGSDLFILGDPNSVFYQGNGKADFADIGDFTAGEDFIQLKAVSGVGSDAYTYSLNNAGNSVEISYGGDLVGRLTNFTDITEAQNSTQFV